MDRVYSYCVSRKDPDLKRENLLGMIPQENEYNS
jgi:hypothetical protein